jgi:hypothetical protein
MPLATFSAEMVLADAIWQRNTGLREGFLRRDLARLSFALDHNTVRANLLDPAYAPQRRLTHQVQHPVSRDGTPSEVI